MKKSEQNLLRLVEFIKDYGDVHGFPPTVRDMCKELNITSTSTISYYLDRLEERNLIIRNPSKNRAIELVKNKVNQEVKPLNLSKIPLIGTITAGIPILAQENYVDTFAISKSLFSNEDMFMLVVSGDSMIDVGIVDGDYIIVKKQETANNGDIVVAMLDGSATVKTFYREKDSIRLQPENPLYKPIISPDIQVLGLVVGVIRKIR